MIKFELIQKQLEVDEELNSNLDSLIEYFIENRTFVLDKNIETINVDILIEEEVIKVVSNKYQVVNYSIIAFKFYMKFKVVFLGELCDDFKTYVKILKEIENSIKSEKFNQGFSCFKKELWSIAMQDANLNMGINFTEYLGSLSIDENGEEVYSFNSGYATALPYLNLDNTTFYNNTIQLVDWTKSDADYNMNLFELLKGVRNKISLQNDFGLSFFEYTLTREGLESCVIIQIIAGLFDRFGIDFYKQHLKKKINNEKYFILVICGLTSADNITEEVAELFFVIYTNANKDNPEVLINLPKLLFAILNVKNIPDNSKLIDNSFRCLEELNSLADKDLRSIILQEIQYKDNHIDAYKKLLLNIVNNPHFQEENHLGSIDHFLWNLKDVKYFEQIVCSLARGKFITGIAKKLNSSIGELIVNNKSEFDKTIINLLITNDACSRKVGIDIFDSISDDNYVFAYNILELSHLNQYKLWVSLLQFDREPKCVITCILPLLRSISPLIKEAFICKLEEYSENYGGHVTEVLRNNLDLENAEMNSIYTRIENYMENYFAEKILVKKEIKELNPHYSQNKIFKDFSKNHYRNFNKEMQKYRDKNEGIMNLFTTVILLKGGGWKTEGKDGISQLGLVSSSFSLPRNYFIEPEHFDFESNRKMSEDWDDSTFDNIKSFLENE